MNILSHVGTGLLLLVLGVALAYLVFVTHDDNRATLLLLAAIYLDGVNFRMRVAKYLDGRE